jgi:hypothetical protein
MPQRKMFRIAAWLEPVPNKLSPDMDIAEVPQVLAQAVNTAVVMAKRTPFTSNVTLSPGPPEMGPSAAVTNTLKPLTLGLNAKV